MDYLEILKEAGIVLGSLLIFFFLFLQGYLKKKGELLAQKQDLKDLTREVESVKSRLTLLSKLEYGHLSERRNSIIELGICIGNWINTINDVGMGGINQDENTLLGNWQIELEKMYREYNNSSSKLALIIEDRNLVAQNDQFGIKVGKAYGSINSHYILARKANNDSIEKANLIVDPNRRQEKISELLETRKKEHKEFCDSVVAAFGLIVGDKNALFGAMRNYLESMLVDDE